MKKATRQRMHPWSAKTCFELLAFWLTKSTMKSWCGLPKQSKVKIRDGEWQSGPVGLRWQRLETTPKPQRNPKKRDAASQKWHPLTTTCGNVAMQDLTPGALRILESGNNAGTRQKSPAEPGFFLNPESPQ